jgi:hypothetical protein
MRAETKNGTFLLKRLPNVHLFKKRKAVVNAIVDKCRVFRPRIVLIGAGLRTSHHIQNRQDYVHATSHKITKLKNIF